MLVIIEQWLYSKAFHTSDEGKGPACPDSTLIRELSDDEDTQMGSVGKGLDVPEDPQ